MSAAGELRRTLALAAVAGGGAAAALMHHSIVCSDEAEIRAAADECLEPVLRGALLIIAAAGILPDEEQRGALRDIIRDYLEAAAQPLAERVVVSRAPMSDIWP